MQTTLDIGVLITGLAWPVVVAIVAWWYRVPLSRLFEHLPKYVKSFKVAGVEVQLAEATPMRLSISEGAVDLRRAGVPNDVNDSTLDSFYKQITVPTRIDYVVVDLGWGQEWLSSRLYILSVILRRMRGLRAIVFVESDAAVRRKFVGACKCESVRWALAAKWTRFESALAAAELRVWGHPYDVSTVPPKDMPGNIVIPRAKGPTLEVVPFIESGQLQIVNAEGRIEDRNHPPAAAADLLRGFLDAIQRPPPPKSADWQELVSKNAPEPVVEYAVWLNGELIDQVLAGVLEKRFVRLHDYQGWSESLRVRAFVEHPGDWVAVTRESGAFERLIDRSELLERLAQRVVTAEDG